MCRHKVLAHNEQGYIIFCNGCGNYQLAFGTSLVSFIPSDFESFCNNLADLKKNTEVTGFEKEKQVFVDIYSRRSMMILNYKELHQLNTLVDEAGFTKQMECLLQESHIKPQGN